MSQEWEEGFPEKEGFYLCIRKRNFSNDFTTPRVCEYIFSRYRLGGELLLDDNGQKQGVWMDTSYANPTHYMELPQLPKI